MPPIADPLVELEREIKQRESRRGSGCNDCPFQHQCPRFIAGRGACIAGRHPHVAMLTAAAAAAVLVTAGIEAVPIIF